MQLSSLTRRRSSVAVSAVSVAVMLAACSGGGGGDHSSSAAKSSGKTSASSSASVSAGPLQVANGFAKTPSQKLSLPSDVTDVVAVTRSGDGANAGVVGTDAAKKIHVFAGPVGSVKSWQWSSAVDVGGEVTFARQVGQSVFLLVAHDTSSTVWSWNPQQHKWTTTNLPGQWGSTTWSGFALAMAGADGTVPTSVKVGRPDGSLVDVQATAPVAGAQGTVTGQAADDGSAPVYTFEKKNSTCRDPWNQDVQGEVCQVGVAVNGHPLTPPAQQKSWTGPAAVTAAGGGYVLVGFAGAQPVMPGDGTQMAPIGWGLWDTQKNTWVAQATSCTGSLMAAHSAPLTTGSVWTSPDRSKVVAGGVLIDVASKKSSCVDFKGQVPQQSGVVTNTGSGWWMPSADTSTQGAGAFQVGSSSQVTPVSGLEPFAVDGKNGWFVGKSNLVLTIQEFPSTQ